MKDVTAGFETRELGRQRKPIELYRMWEADGTATYRYTSHDEDVTYGGFVYKAVPITRNTVSYDVNLNSPTVEITAGYIEDPALKYIATNPLRPYWVEILKLHSEDLSEALVIFIGQIKTVAFKGLAAKIKATGFEFYLDQTIPRFRYMPSCNNKIYEGFCKAAKGSFTKSGTAVTVSANCLTITTDIVDTIGEYSSTYWRYGEILIGADYSVIASHTGNPLILTLSSPLPNAEDGDSITISAGCDKSYATCNGKFNQRLNFFGQPFIPTENPTIRIRE